MKRDLQEVAKEKNVMVASGQIVDAAEKYFAASVKTIDFDGTTTEGKHATMKKLSEFVGELKIVNEISLLRSATDGDVSFAEYIFSFEMNDGSKIYWHEIIRSLWESGEIVEERYFKA